MGVKITVLLEIPLLRKFYTKYIEDQRAQKFNLQKC